MESISEEGRGSKRVNLDGYGLILSCIDCNPSRSGQLLANHKVKSLSVTQLHQWKVRRRQLMEEGKATRETLPSCRHCDFLGVQDLL